MNTKKQNVSSKPVKKGLLGQNVEADGSAWDWGAVDGDELRQLVELVTNRGGAIRFGYSRDGNAGSVGIYWGDERDTVYIRPGEDFQFGIRHIVAFFSEKPITGGRSPDIQ